MVVKKQSQAKSVVSSLKCRSLPFIPSLADPQSAKSAKSDQMEFKESSGFHSSLAMSPIYENLNEISRPEVIAWAMLRIFSR